MGGSLLAPYRLCCGKRHWETTCPDGLTMCTLCFERFTKDQLSRNAQGELQNVCKGCAALEFRRLNERIMCGSCAGGDHMCAPPCVCQHIDCIRQRKRMEEEEVGELGSRDRSGTDPSRG